MWDQVDEGAEDSDAVNVSRKLEQRELKSSKNSKKAIDAGDLVEDQRQRNQFGAGLEANKAEEGLSSLTISTMPFISRPFDDLVTKRKRLSQINCQEMPTFGRGIRK